MRVALCYLLITEAALALAMLRGSSPPLINVLHEGIPYLFHNFNYVVRFGPQVLVIDLDVAVDQHVP